MGIVRQLGEKADEIFDQANSKNRQQYLDDKFASKSFTEKMGTSYSISKFYSYFAQVFSAITASSLVYLFVASLVKNIFFSALITVIVIVIFESIKRVINDTYWTDMVQHKKNKIKSLIFVVIALSMMSIASSYYGAKDAVVALSGDPELIQLDSATADLRAQLDANNKQIADARKTQWKGTTTRTSQQTIDKLTEQNSVLLEQINTIREETISSNNTTAKLHQAMTSVKAETFGLVTLGLELSFIFVMWFLSYFDYREYLERKKHQEEEEEERAYARDKISPSSR